MLKYKVGDLIQAAVDGEVNVIAHCANCFNTMKSGIAPQIAMNFPEALHADRLTLKGDKRKLGEYSRGWDGFHGVNIFNLYGQYNYGREKGVTYIKYPYLRSAMKGMRSQMDDIYDDACPASIGLPKLGSGLANGDWDTIEQIIKDELTAYNYDVTIYVLDESEIPNRSNEV